jgi:hypothetical protein
MNNRYLRWAIINLGLLFAGSLSALEIDYYLPQAANYDAQIATPKSVLGFEVGEWHVRPEQIERYLITLAKLSPRVNLKVIGYTHEKRPLFHVYISSPENLARLESIREQHLAEPLNSQIPIVSWMGYSVHGNEASGSNASLLLAYHLAASTAEETLAQLRDQIIIIDPMLNPDGLARFAHWVNSYKSQTLNVDPQHIEHNESWPNGRTNHYWFDLNRDWLLLQHPESEARVAEFHRWRPNLLTDFHEMGTDSTYFFQPGVPSRQNPLTPQANFDMTATIAKHHAAALDGIGSLYYSKEDFDDFYYGKGSTYPDIHGTVGILFEQASARGHAQESDHGKLTLPFAIRNHLTTSLSTLQAAQLNQQSLKQMQQDFRLESKTLGDKDRNRALILSSSDNYRLAEVKRILSGHRIEFFPLSKAVTIEKRKFQPERSLIIPLQQAQYRLIVALFETRTEFPDKVFYDVSAWNLALALDLDYTFVDRSDFSLSLMDKSSREQSDIDASSTQGFSTSSVALAIDWADLGAARLLSEIHQAKFRVQTVTQPTRLQTHNGPRDLTLGSLILPLNNQPQNRQQILEWIAPQLVALGISAIEISSGLAVSGVDMGSPSLPVVAPVKPLLVIGNGFSSYAAGEIWHLLDQRLAQPLTMMNLAQLAKLTKIDYTHIILVDGKPEFDQAITVKIEAWVKAGGVLLAHSGSAEWLLKQGWTSSEVKKFDKPVDTRSDYADKGQIDAEHHVGGAITETEIDISHPLGFGLSDKSLAVFKRNSLVFSEAKEAFVSIARFNDKPLVSGYLSSANQQHLVDGTSLLVQALGKGRLIAFTDDPVFRGYWLGTARVFINALYFGPLIEAPVKRKEDKKEPEAVKKTNSEA